MKLTLKNIGKFADATVEFNGITLMAGENGSGKSTVAKVLWCVCYVLDTARANMLEQLAKSMFRAITGLSYDDAPLSVSHIYYPCIEFANNRETYLDNEQWLSEDLARLSKDINIAIDHEKVKIIAELLASDYNTFVIWQFEKSFNSTFSNQPVTFGKNSAKISYEDMLSKGGIEFINEVVIDITQSGYELSRFVHNLRKGVSVFDGTSIFDEGIGDLDVIIKNNYFGAIERLLLYPSLSFMSDVEVQRISGKYKDVLELINKVCPGTLEREGGQAMYCEHLKPNVMLCNVANGLKQFLLLKMCLLHGLDGYIIMDEPETCLHPNWQLIYAEVVVMLAKKEPSLRILINTHSPYFTEAIEGYAKKHGIADKCKYYLAENKGETAEIRDVTGNLDPIYDKLWEAFEKNTEVMYNNG